MGLGKKGDADHHQPDVKRRSQGGPDRSRKLSILGIAQGRRRLLREDDLQSGRRDAHQEEYPEEREPNAVFRRRHPAIGHHLGRRHEHAAAHRGDHQPAALAEKGRVTLRRGRGRRFGCRFRAQVRPCCC